MKLLIQGASVAEEVPGLMPLPDGVEVVFAADENSLSRELPGAEVMLGWNYRIRELQSQWHLATDLKWINWCAAGVDAALFDGMKNSNVLLTNAGGIFDHAMAESILAYMLMVAKDFQTTMAHQKEKTWQYRMTRQLKGNRVLIIGVGSIGRTISRYLRKVGLQCYGAGRSVRENDVDFDKIFDSAEVMNELKQFDWIVGVLPSTPQTENYFDANFFNNMSSKSHFINVGRGSAVVESALMTALKTRQIDGAMLDVFQTEPLTDSDPLWGLENLFISPHITGDYEGFESDMVKLFKQNLTRYLNGSELMNIVDKELGFVARSNGSEVNHDH